LQKFGYELLHSQAAYWLAGELEDVPSDSEIERLLLAALIARARLSATEYTDLIVVADDAAAAQQLDAFRRMIVRPQAPIDRRRVDFLIKVLDWRGPKERWYWRSLIIECDGHDFHTSKEQTARDRAKDRTATLDDFDFFRFTGSEIWRDPWGCAEQITDWAVKGFG
jgi:very-short-patch-repair endonuclease